MFPCIVAASLKNFPLFLCNARALQRNAYRESRNAYLFSCFTNPSQRNGWPFLCDGLTFSCNGCAFLCDELSFLYSIRAVRSKRLVVSEYVQGVETLSFKVGLLVGVWG